MLITIWRIYEIIMITILMSLMFTGALKTVINQGIIQTITFLLLFVIISTLPLTINYLQKRGVIQ